MLCFVAAAIGNFLQIASKMSEKLQNLGDAMVSTQALHPNIYKLSMKYHEQKLSQVLTVLQSGCLAGTTIVTAGAWLGESAVPLAQRGLATGQRVYAIDPTKSNLEFIELQKQKHSLENLHLVHSLLSDSATQRFWTNRRAGSPAARFVPSDAEPELASNASAVQSTTVDLMVREGTVVGHVGLLHFDVEGMEFEVVRGSLRTLHTFSPVLVVESMKDDAEKHLKLHKLLRDRNYTASWKVQEKCAFLDVLDKKHCRNHIYLHSSSPCLKSVSALPTFILAPTGSVASEA